MPTRHARNPEARHSRLPGPHVAGLVESIRKAIERRDPEAYRVARGRLVEHGYFFGRSADCRPDDSTTTTTD